MSGTNGADGLWVDREPARDRSPLVMVVDDDPDFRSALADWLADDEVEVVEAHSGDDALAMLQTLVRARGRRPDLILVDVMMPGMSGAELVQHLTALPGVRTVPIVAITAVNDLMLQVRLGVPVIYKTDAETMVAGIRQRLPQ